MKHKAEDGCKRAHDVLEARMAAMALEERAAFVAKAAVAERRTRSRLPRLVGDASAVSVDDEAASAAAPQTPSAQRTARAARPCRRTRCCAIFSAPVRRSIPRIGSI
ncbi:MAG: hypothetical protein ACLSVD_12030 [Eggerthellaceae bacterium]